MPIPTEVPFQEPQATPQPTADGPGRFSRAYDAARNLISDPMLQARAWRVGHEALESMQIIFPDPQTGEPILNTGELRLAVETPVATAKAFVMAAEEPAKRELRAAAKGAAIVLVEKGVKGRSSREAMNHFFKNSAPSAQPKQPANF